MYSLQESIVRGLDGAAASLIRWNDLDAITRSWRGIMDNAFDELLFPSIPDGVFCTTDFRLHSSNVTTSLTIVMICAFARRLTPASSRLSGREKGCLWELFTSFSPDLATGLRTKVPGYEDSGETSLPRGNGSGVGEYEVCEPTTVIMRGNFR